MDRPPNFLNVSTRSVQRAKALSEKDQELFDAVLKGHASVLDGRNRQEACEIAGIKPIYEQWVDPGCGPTRWVISMNLERRHLTASQRACIAVLAIPLLAEEAKQTKAMSGARQVPLESHRPEPGSPTMDQG